mgnify:CR=1 FL=1
MAKQKKALKKMTFIIEYEINPEDAGAIGEVIDKMRETGVVEILDVTVRTVGE